MLKISHLQKNYRGFSLDCSMEVQPGMITGLIGRNGSGKSTTFKALLGLIHPDGGEIEVFGKKAEELKPEDKQKLGVVFADSGFSMYLTAAGVANIMKSIYPDFDREKFLQQCRRFNLPTDKKIKEFSTGMKAKFKVLAALSHKAELLILDEPTVGLDVIARDEVLNMLREYMEEYGEIIKLLKSRIFYYDSKKKEIQYFNPREIPNVKMTVLSATPASSRRCIIYSRARSSSI